MNFDELPEYLREKWWMAARDQYMITPLHELKEYQLEVLVWYLKRMGEGWDEEPPQSANEERLWLLNAYNLYQVKLELIKRRAAFYSKSLKAHEPKLNLGPDTVYRRVIVQDKSAT